MIEMELGKNAKLLCKSCWFKLKRFLSLLSLLKIPAPQLTSDKKIVVFSVFLETVILISWWPDSLGLKSRPRNLGPRHVMSVRGQVTLLSRKPSPARPKIRVT